MNLIKHIQFQQLINLLLLILVAYLNTTLQTSWLNIVVLMLFSGALELSIKRVLYIPYSAFITALGVVLMVGWLKWYIPYVVVALAILQKHYIKIDNKHIFNPSNFALIAAIFLFYPKALPIVGELGKNSYIVYFVIALGSLILIRVNRYIITASFLLSFIALNYLIIGKSDPTWSFEHFISMLYATSFIVYIFFMLTDPITTPNKALHQIYFGSFTAILIVTLDYYLGVRLWHQFIALFVSSIIFTPLYTNVNKDYKKFTIIIVISLIVLLFISIKNPIYFSM
jgi:hypothetical protein